ncbi:hypothetical protein ALC56_05922 [Trachymyrmex septentrionalis]|uniref:Uncharacterized protein n=1 Tax=Trachymyrmex septentrionalis TaxID=34720 RepID=A0A195FHE6_9HYME|nr:hypothetical protein ALC56_05922 [Trachymyrmex septentrionalis]
MLDARLGDQSSRFRYVYPAVEGYSGSKTGRWMGIAAGSVESCRTTTPSLSSVLAGDIAATMPEARTLAGKASIG